MSVGFPVTKQEVDNRAGQLVVQLRDTLADVVAFKAWLDSATTTDAFLQGLGYTAGEVTLLRASYTDLKKLSDVSHAQAVQAAPSDFFFNAKVLAGVV